MVYTYWDRNSPFWRRHFQMHFVGRKFMWYHSNFTEFCSGESKWQCVKIGLGNGLAPSRRQAMVWTNVDPVHWDLYTSLGLGEITLHILTHYDVIKWKLPCYRSFMRGIHRSFPSKTPVTRSIGAFFDLRRNKRLSKHWRRRWFETPSRSSWRHCNALRSMLWKLFGFYGTFSSTISRLKKYM